MPMNQDEVVRLIREALPDAAIDIKDLRGDGDYYQIYVESRDFVGKTTVQQHQIIHAALQGRVGGVLKALTLQTAVPQKA